jgi:basic membrane lipoprotein Med (substrate-binding protein (PBP1-ABC) superfamily)
MDIPEVNRVANVFIAEVKEANPNAKVVGSYIGAFWDPVKTKETAL